MTTYSISLDDVDLAFLPLRTQKYNNFLKKELFQFQVMKTKTVDEPVPTIFYTCHVCAIEVPAAFASEHIASVKHKANTRIANVAMQRTRKLISSLPIPFTTKPSARFCANCATLAEENHDKTKEHRDAVMLDNMLWELMKAYIGDNDKSNNENILNDNNKGDKHIIVGDRTKDEYSSVDSNNKDINAIAIPIKSIVKYQKTEETKNIKKVLKYEPVTKTCENIKKDEEVTKVETRKKDTIRNKTEINESTYKHISDTNNWRDGSLIKGEDLIRNMKDPNRPNNVVTNETETNEHSAKHDNNNVDFQSRYESLFPPFLRNNRAPNSFIDVITSKTTTTKSKEPSFVTNQIESRQQREKGDNKLSTMLASLTNDSFEIIESKKGIHIKIHDDILNIDSDNFNSYVRFNGNDKEIKCLVCDCILTNEDSEAHKYDLNHLRIIANIGYGNDYVRKINDIYSHCILCNMKIHDTVVAVHKNFCYHLVNKDKNINITTNSDKLKKEADTTTQRKSNEILRGIPVIQNENANDEIIDVESNDIVDAVIKYPYVEFSGELRCVVCNCRVPRTLQNRNDHINGSRHIKNMNKA